MKKTKYILTLVLLPFFVLSQNAIEKKKVQMSVSKYSIKMDRNTKEKEMEKEETQFQANSFNFHYSNYLNSDITNKDYTSLLLAHDLSPTNTELYFELAKYYELKQNDRMKKEFCKKLKETKLSPSLREYAYNTLMSVSKNGILVTYGEDDTYPIWVLQVLENVRKDVKILNYDLMLTEEYRTLQKKRFGLSFAKKYSTNIKILKDIGQMNKDKNIYYSLTVSHLILKELKNELYPTGLALKYSKSKMDNSAILVSNWETKFQKNYITNATINSKDKKVNLNYILPLLQLSKYYKENDEETKQDQLVVLIRKIGKSGGKQKQVEALLK